MGIWLLILFIAAPLGEIAVFIQVGEQLGVLSTIALTVLTAIIGTALLRYQGLQTMARLREQMVRQEPPQRELFNGACLLFAGALLLVPGFITDTLGLLLFVPTVRTWLFGWLAARVQNRQFQSSAHGFGRGAGAPAGGPARAKGPIIDGEFEDISDDPKAPPKDNSPWRLPR